MSWKSVLQACLTLPGTTAPRASHCIPDSWALRDMTAENQEPQEETHHSQNHSTEK